MDLSLSPLVLRMKDKLTNDASSFGSMTSRNSSNMSLDDISRDSFTGASLEYDDYPLDLVSPIVINNCSMPETNLEADLGVVDLHSDMATIFKNAWRPPSPPPMRDKQVDRIVGDEMITDYGRRSWCDYPENTDFNGDVFINYRASLSLSQSQSNYTDKDTVIMKDSSEETHFIEQNEPRGCQACRHACLRVLKPCLLKYQALPDKPTRLDRLKYMFLCPPHGKLSRVLSLLTVLFTLYGVAWGVLGERALPGGDIFALFILISVGYISGKVMQLIHLPPLLGMLITGVLLRNVPRINVAKDIDAQFITIIRYTGLAIFLLHKGLAVDLKSLKLSSPVIRLATLPCLLEVLTTALVAHFVLNFPWVWSFLLGLLMSSVASSITKPYLLHLNDEGFGTQENIPNLATTAMTVQDKLTLTGFSLFLAIVFTKGGMVLTVFKGPLELVGGIIYGILTGIICWYIPDTRHRNRTLLRIILLLGFGLFAVFGSQSLWFPAAGALGCLTTGLVANMKWRQNNFYGQLEKNVENSIEILWCAMEPLTIALVGAEIHINHIDAKLFGLATSVVLLGTLVRITMSFCCMLGMGYTFKEKLFFPCTWLSSGILQVILSCVALDTARYQGDDSETVQLAYKVAFVSVLAVFFTTPIGCVLLKLAGPRLLTKSKLHLEECRVKIDLDSPESSPYRVSEVPTEFETVT